MRRLRKHLPVLLNNNLATISIFLALVVLAVGFVKVVHLTRDGKQAHDAICALKGDLAQRINQGRDFLKTHPKGILGIPAATIKEGIDNQQRTLDSLGVVKCTADERKGKPA